MAISFQKPRYVFQAVLFLANFIMTFLYFLYYPLELKIFMPVLTIIFLGSPVVTLFTCLIFSVCKGRAAFTWAKIWTAFYAAYLFISCATFQSNGSLGDVIAHMFLGICVLILMMMLVVIGVKNYRHRQMPGGLLSRWLLRDTFAAIIGGWAAGITLWSFTTPPAIISAAEKIAAGAPYCINAYFGPARSLFDLTALRFFSPAYRFRHAYDFHGTLSVIEQTEGDVAYQHLYYWSYRKKTFLSYANVIYDTTKNNGCIAYKQFAEKLPIL